jgi:hypothetical protein
MKRDRKSIVSTTLRCRPPAFADINAKCYRSMSLKSDITRPEGVAMNLVLRRALIAIAVAVTVAGLADLCIWMMSGA